MNLEDRAIISWSKRRRLDAQAQRALLSASEDLTVCCLASLGRLRASGDPLATLFAENRRLRAELAELRGALRIVQGRDVDVPPRCRRHYKPSARFAILEHMRTFLLPVEATARRFLVSPQTIYNWLAELREHPEAKTIGSLLDPIPPVRRYANVVRRLARQMKAFGFGGNGQIAATLARIGWKPSRRSVGRFCRERPAPAPTPPALPKRPATSVRGRYPNHLWLADITRIRLLLPFVQLHLAVVLDAYSRMPLAASVSYFEPSAASMLALVQTALGSHARPRHFVSDQGEQFTADLFRSALRRLGIRQRFGAIGEHGSIALIERFWRSLKSDLRLRSIRPWNLQDFERRLEPALLRYAYCRPHSALAGRLPAEVYFGLPEQRPLVNSAPRAQPGQPEPECPVEILFLDPDNGTLPILVPKAA